VRETDDTRSLSTGSGEGWGKTLLVLMDTIWVNLQAMMDRIDGLILSTVDIMGASFELPLTRK
jgi:hypothetical protein